jgi:hypothetical protein
MTKNFKKYFFGKPFKFANAKDMEPIVPLNLQITLSPAQATVVKFFIDENTGKTYLAQNLKNAELDIPAFIKKIRKFADELEESNQYASK